MYNFKLYSIVTLEVLQGSEMETRGKGTEGKSKVIEYT